MLTKTFLAFCVLCAFVLIGCTKTETTNNSNSTTSNSNKTTTTSSTSATSTGDKVGVPECDDYITKYEACINGKVPEMARAQFNSSMKTLRRLLAQGSYHAEGKAGLAAACKQAAEQAKSSMKPYGCDF